MNSRSSAKSVANHKISNHEALKAAVLGPGYELSLVFCGDTLSHKLNLQYRKKDKPTNVLAFPLSETSGEIFINTERQDSFSDLELIIHALLHLKGMQHGARMESEEKKIFELFNGAPSRSRHRHRHSPGQGGHRRGDSRRK